MNALTISQQTLNDGFCPDPMTVPITEALWRLRSAACAADLVRITDPKAVIAYSVIQMEHLQGETVTLEPLGVEFVVSAE